MKLSVFFNIFCFFFFMSYAAFADAEKLTVKIVPPDHYDNVTGSEAWDVYIDGPIDDGSPKLILAKLLASKGKSFEFYLNSPGGSLIAGMKIGKIIRKYGYSTQIAQYDADSTTNNKAGGCYSACALAYLGGMYRFNFPDSVYGVHRFSKDTSDSDDLDMAQIVSAAVMNYIAEMDVSPKLFEKMVEAGSSEIKILTQSELKSLSVVNEGRLKATWTIEVVEGGTYLKGRQLSVYGDAKLLFSCGPDGLRLHAIYEAGDNAADILNNSSYFALMLNGDTVDLPAPSNKINDNGWINVFHKFPEDILPRLVQSNDIGYAMQWAKGAPSFRGFRIDLTDDQDRMKVKNYLYNCKSKKY